MQQWLLQYRPATVCSVMSANALFHAVGYKLLCPDYVMPRALCARHHHYHSRNPMPTLPVAISFDSLCGQLFGMGEKLHWLTKRRAWGLLKLSCFVCYLEELSACHCTASVGCQFACKKSQARNHVQHICSITTDCILKDALRWKQIKDV